MAVTCVRYTMNVTIKQVIVGTVIGTTIVGIMVQRLRTENENNSQARLVASSKLAPHGLKKHAHTPEVEQSSRKLDG
jgi:hypothetical protein